MRAVRYDDDVLSLLFTVHLPSARDEDAGLLARVARQDRAALRSLHERMSGAALAVALRILGTRTEAEEVVQDAFVEVWRRAAQYDPTRGGVRTWVLAIARNRAIDRLRSRGANARAIDGVRAQGDDTTLVTPQESLEQREMRERVQAALMSLPPEQRQTLELTYFEGLTQREIAERTGEPLGTIKSRVRAALEKLARLLPGGRP